MPIIAAAYAPSGEEQKARAAARSNHWRKSAITCTSGRHELLQCMSPLLVQSGHSTSSSLTTSGLPIHPGTQVATSRCINLHLIDVPKKKGE
jgi:hypothetical protein